MVVGTRQKIWYEKITASSFDKGKPKIRQKNAIFMFKHDLVIMVEKIHEKQTF